MRGAALGVAILAQIRARVAPACPRVPLFMARRGLDALGERAALVEAAVRGAVLAGASRQVAAAVAAAAVRSVRDGLPFGGKARTPGAAEEAAPGKQKRKRKRKRKGKPRGEDGVVTMAVESPHPSDDDGLGDEWADGLPAVASVALGAAAGDAAGDAARPALPALPAASPVPPSPAAAPLPVPPTRVLRSHASRERSPRRASSPSVRPLVVGCLATVRDLDARADLNGSQVRLIELDASTQRWRVETLGGETVRIKMDRLRFHLPG